MLTSDVVYLRWAHIDTKVLGTLLLIVGCLTRRNERHLTRGQKVICEEGIFLHLNILIILLGTKRGMSPAQEKHDLRVFCA